MTPPDKTGCPETFRTHPGVLTQSLRGYLPQQPALSGRGNAKVILLNVILQTTGPWAETLGQSMCESHTLPLGGRTQSNRQKGKHR